MSSLIPAARLLIDRLVARIGPIYLLVVVGFLAGGVWLAATVPAFFAAQNKVTDDLVANSGGVIMTAIRLSGDTHPDFVMWTRAESAGDLVCEVVRPTLIADGVPDANFEIRNKATGALLADQTATCIDGSTSSP